jgi:hypothetical protein
VASASGHLAYATIDVGYDFLRAPGAKVGAFVGYSYYEQGINTHSCAQVAGDTTCAPPFVGEMGVTEYDHFNSLRVGLASQIMLTNRLRLTSDAAYVPLVSYSGVDNHLCCNFLVPHTSNSGSGVMLEAVLDYDVTHAWSVGIGGRSWAWNMNAGPATFLDTLPHLGGGASGASWSDPFGSTAVAGSTNVAGFGDDTHASGPLGGGQIGADWQTGPWVLGVQADASAAHMAGENTCFSGLGGINCQHIITALGTVTRAPATAGATR